MADFSLSDIKALMGDGDANGIVWVLLIVLLMGGGSWGNRDQVATQEFVQNGFNFNDLQDQNRDIMGAITGEIPVWKQPTGAQDAYRVGARVHFPTKDDPVYENDVDYNVYAPNVTGWHEVI